MKNKIKCLIVIVTLTFCFCFFSGCSNNNKNIKIAVVNWPEARCMTEVVKTILEKEMNYNVEVELMNIDSVFEALANGKCDIFLDCWLPITHEKYIYEYGGKIENLGFNYKGARTGLVVPSYVSINSIIQLNECKDKFNSTIIGIEPDAGIIKSTKKAVERYELDYELITTSSAEMVGRLDNAIKNQEWIIVTGWQPHWKFTKWNLKFLNDPSFLYGGEESLHTIARKDFSKDYPEVTEFLFNFRLDKNQLGELLFKDKYDFTERSEEFIIQWIEDNKELVDGWLIEK